MSKRIFTILSLTIAGFSFGQTEILNEDFENGIPGTWKVVDVDHQIPNAQVSEYTSAWISKIDPEDSSNKAVSSTSYYTPAGTANKWLITPAIELGTFGNYLSFRAMSFDPSYPENYKILISNSDQVADFNDTVRLITLENPEWFHRDINLSLLGFNGQTVHIAFVNTTNDGFTLYLDDIKVRKMDPLAINKNVKPDFRIYPNPATDSFRIGSDQSIEKIDIYSLEGKLISENSYEAGKSIDIQYLTPGVYYLNIHSGSTSSTVKLVKQ